MDGTFFTIEQNENGKIMAKCMECQEVKKGNIFSTGNFINHYKSKHSSRVKSLEAYLKKIEPHDATEANMENTITVRHPAITQCFGEAVTPDIVSIGFFSYLKFQLN